MSNKEANQKELIKMDLTEAIKELKLIKQGKLNARDAEDLINEL